MTTRVSRIFLLATVLSLATMAAFASVPVQNLERKDIVPLQEAFNAHPERVRLLLLLSPGCGRCLDTSREVEKLLHRIEGERIQVLVVWQPLLSTDSYMEAQKTADLITDRRAVHYWEPARILGLEYGQRLPLPGQLNFAVDMVLLFPPGASWSDAGLPAPEAWFHKFGDDERTFSVEKLRDEILQRLESSPSAHDPKP